LQQLGLEVPSVFPDRLAANQTYTRPDTCKHVYTWSAGDQKPSCALAALVTFPGHARLTRQCAFARLQEYIDQHSLQKVVEDVLNGCVKTKPDEPLSFMVREALSPDLVLMIQRQHHPVSSQCRSS
jgi:hypothetical protein